MKIKLTSVFSATKVANVINLTALLMMGGCVSRNFYSPQKEKQVAIQCLVTSDTGQQTVFYNIAPYWQLLSDKAQKIHEPSVEKVRDDCTSFFSKNGSNGLDRAQILYWIVRNGQDNRDTLPYGAKPYSYDSYGDLISSQGEDLGNYLILGRSKRNLAAQFDAAVELQDKAHDMSTFSLQNFEYQGNSRGIPVPPISKVVKYAGKAVDWVERVIS